MAAQNWALASNGSTATTSDDLIPAWGGDKAIDGDNGTNWHSTNSSGHSLEVDFGQNRLLDKVEIRTARADSGYAFGYGVDYWDGSSWVSIVSGQNANNGAAEYTWVHTFTEVTASKIRLVTTGAVYVVVQEFRGWGNPPAPPACDVVTFALSVQDANGVVGTIGECEAVSFALSIQDIDGFITEAPPDLGTLWTSSFVEERTRYFVSAPDFEAVTRNHEYEDAGKSFNELSDNPPQTWEIVFRGKTQTWVAILDSHFAEYRFSRPFNFLAKDGETYSVYYKEYSPNHEAHKSWIQERRVVLIKYP